MVLASLESQNNRMMVKPESGMMGLPDHWGKK